jgi:50S ribosomal protein L16 3-hydroxylase
MLYLPPGIAHDGVAETECLTWSIGFRAPSDAEIAQGFLDYLRDAVAIEGHYSDRGARRAAHPGELPAPLVEHVARTLQRIRWSGRDARLFAGRLLSEPKAHVFFEPPARALTLAAFTRLCRKSGIALDARSRLLFSGTIFFLNGEPFAAPADARALLRRLADARSLPAGLDAPASFWRAAHGAYERGFIVPGEVA